jgi:hypothetical protein
LQNDAVIIATINLSAEDFNDSRYEYGLRIKENTFSETPQPLKRLFDKLPMALSPKQPTEGWVRFMAKDINPDKIEQGTIKLTVTDSVGQQYSIHKVPSERERRGEIALRRVG